MIVGKKKKRFYKKIYSTAVFKFLSSERIKLILLLIVLVLFDSINPLRAAGTNKRSNKSTHTTIKSGSHSIAGSYSMRDTFL